MRSTERKLSAWPYRSYNRGRWDNDLGTLNLLGPTTTARAIASIQSHEVFGIGAPLRTDEIELNARAYEFEMVSMGSYSFSPDEPVQSAGERVTIGIHGMTNSHIDAYAHVGHHGSCFNDARFDEIISEKGAARFSVMDMPAVVTRAWLVDVPRQRGVEALKRGDPVAPDDLMPFAGKVKPGDALVIRTGRYVSAVVKPDDPDAADNHGNWSGLHWECLDLIADWDLSTVATDSSGDNFPSTTPDCTVPIHIVTEGYIGLPLIHHLDVEALAARIATRDGADFMLCVAPLKIVGGTGSPVNPTAII
jgi:kynurenine formamidase